MKILYYLLVGFTLSLFEVNLVWGQDNLIISGPRSATPGSNNTFIGLAAGSTGSTAQSNVFIGTNAGSLNNGRGNAYIGVIAGLRTLGNENTYMGYWAGYSLSGNQNVAIGRYAGFGGGLFSELDKSKGSYNVYVGASAGYMGYPNGTDYNTMIGDSAGFNNVARGNVMMGSKAGYTNRTGQLNTYLGYQSGYNAVADSNTFVGYQSGYNTTSGRGNTFFGNLSGQGISTGNHNTIIGNKAGPSGGDGDDNIYMGYATGQKDGGSRNTFIGTSADALAQNLTNATAIGAGAGVSISNAVVLGHEANVGIGTTAPTARLHVRSEKANEAGIRMENLTSHSPTVAQTNAVLSVNELGDVILVRAATDKLIVKRADDWADRVFEPGYTLWSLAQVEQYVNEHKHLPNVPSAKEVVSQGYEATAMDALLLEKIEETTLYVIRLQREVNQLRQQNQSLKRAVRQLKRK